MKLLIQRALSSFVEVDSKKVGEIPYGMVLFVGFKKGENPDFEKIVEKIVHLRIFKDEKGEFNSSILEVKGKILCISQFTLYASIKKGRRPDFSLAMPYEEAKDLYQKFVEVLKKQVPVETGIFGEDMKVSLTNDGPVTILVESEDL